MSRLRHPSAANISWIIAPLIVSIGGCTDDEALPVAEVVDVQILANGDLAAGLPVRYERFDVPRLDELKLQEDLDFLLVGATSEFEQLLRVKEWVAEQWPHGTPNPYPPWDAIVILDWIRSGITGGFCGQYSQVLLQSLAALGWTARYVEIGSAENPYAHFVVEVWSNQFDKWVLLDADFNLHFEREGIPLSALEVHDALVQDALADVVTVLGDTRIGHPDPAAWPLHTVELYYYLRVHLKANHLSVPDEPPFDRYNDMIEWHDSHTVPWESSEVPSPYRKMALTNLSTTDRASVESKLNQVDVTIESVEKRRVDPRFANNALGLGHYQLRSTDVTREAGEWEYLESDVFRWMPTPWKPILEVRTVNVRGVSGPASVIRADMVCSQLLDRLGACD